ncbi:MAG: PTPA-CTERM sorting domain-containing protein [Cyanobacteria bacterium J06633_23]
MRSQVLWCDRNPAKSPMGSWPNVAYLYIIVLELSSMKAQYTFLSLITTGLAMVAAAAPATAANVFVGDREFSVSTISGETYENVLPTLKKQLFYGNEALAVDLAQQHATKGPLFAYLLNERFISLDFIGIKYDPTFVTTNIPPGSREYGDEVYRQIVFAASCERPDFVECIPTPADISDVQFAVLEQVPTPALLPGLIGMGLAAVRKRKQAREA